jgi:hypothetical protein
VYSDLQAYWRTAEPKETKAQPLPSHGLVEQKRYRAARTELRALYRGELHTLVVGWFDPPWPCIPWRKPNLVEIKKFPDGLAAEYPAPAYPPLPKERWSRATVSPPRINYSNPTYVEIAGSLASVIHLHPQKAWHFSTKPWKLNRTVSGNATEHYLAGDQNRERDKPSSDRDLVSRINDTLTPEKHRIFES